MTSPSSTPTVPTDNRVLAQQTVHDLPDAVPVPTYDRDQLSPAVVHIGVGGFHREPRATDLDDLAERGISTDRGITGVGLRSSERGEVLDDQDPLFSVVVRSPERDDVRVVGSGIGHLHAPSDREAALALLADGRTRLVTLTITGSAYPSEPVDPVEDELVRADVETPDTPGTASGFIVGGLARRRQAGLPPFTVLSCDDVQHTGAARQAVVPTAQLRDPALAAWIEENVTFPSSMVDRISPETSPERRDEIADRYGTADRWPVVTEPFSQWVVEHSFCHDRPPLDQVDVELVSDVRPFEAMADPTVRGHVEGFLTEAADELGEVPGVDLPAYAATLGGRFPNPQVGRQVAGSCRRSTTTMAAYVFSSLHLPLDHDVFGSASGQEQLALELEAALDALEAGPLEAVVSLTSASAKQVA